MRNEKRNSIDTFKLIANCNFPIVLPGIFEFFAVFVDAKGLIDLFDGAVRLLDAVLEPLQPFEFVVGVARGNPHRRVEDG